MAGKHHRRRRQRSKGPAALIFAASIWFFLAVSGYAIYIVVNEGLSLTSSGKFNRDNPIATIAPSQPGPVEQLELSSSVILNDESAALYNQLKQKHLEPVEQEESDEVSGAMEILGPGWLLSQRGDAFTIQFITSTNMDELVDFSKGFTGQQPATIYPFKHSGEVVSYGLARGIFNTLDDARASLKNEPPEMLQHQPWIRPVEQVSRQIKSFIER